MRVSNALGNKIIHPFADFLLHDVGTGDGIVQNGGPTTRNRIRTAPLWGLRARGRFMHDNLSFGVGGRDRAPRQPGRGLAQRLQQPLRVRPAEAGRLPAVPVDLVPPGRAFGLAPAAHAPWPGPRCARALSGR